MIITIQGKKYNANRFYDVLIFAKKDKIDSVFVRDPVKDNRYFFKRFNKGDLIGKIYFIEDTWTTFKNEKKWKSPKSIEPKFFFVKTKDILPNLIDIVSSGNVKTASQEQKEFESKIKEKPSFWQNLNTTLFLGGGILLLSMLAKKQ